jgi:hypothetical protein
MHRPTLNGAPYCVHRSAQIRESKGMGGKVKTAVIKVRPLFAPCCASLLGCLVAALRLFVGFALACAASANGRLCTLIGLAGRIQPVVVARRASERAVYRVINQVGQSGRYAAAAVASSSSSAKFSAGGRRRFLNGGASDNAEATSRGIGTVSFEGVRCQFGRATQSAFVDVVLDLDSDRGVLAVWRAGAT